MPNELRINNVSVPVPANPKDNPTSAQLNHEEILKILTQAWEHYKTNMIDTTNGRPLCDRDGSDIDSDSNSSERLTFSEGVSYVLLRAVWMNDEAVFHKTWTWARDHLQRINVKQVYSWDQKRWINNPKKDHLFAWRYTPGLAGRKGGVIHQLSGGSGPWRGSLESASDADLDIAAALIFAYKRWKKNEYRREARKIMNDIWKKYVKQVNGKYYLFAGDQFQKRGEINPSYFRPAYFSELFPAVDSDHPWKDLTATSYEVIRESGDLPLKDEKNKNIPGLVNLPPNWVDLTPEGKLTDSHVFQNRGGQLFGWDSFRTLFAVAEDMAWRGNPNARAYLTDNTCTSADAGPYCFLKKELTSKGKILGGYNHDGSSVTSRLPQANGLNQEQFAMYGAYLPFFYYAGDLEATQKILDLLQSSYNPQGYWGGDPDNYYGQNWAWFGLALINHLPTARFTPVTSVPAAPLSTQILPEGFPNELPEDLFIRNSKKIKELLGGRDGIINRREVISKLKGKVDMGEEHLVQFENLVILWLLNRDIGNPPIKIGHRALDPLEEAMKSKDHASAYWKTKLATILITGNPDPTQMKVLQELGYVEGYVEKSDPNNFTPLKTQQKYEILNKIKNAYLDATQPVDEKGDKETRDYLLEVEMLVRLANLSSRPELLQEAEKKLKFIINNDLDFDKINNDLDFDKKSTPKRNSNSVYQSIARRMTFRKEAKERDLRPFIEDEFKFVQRQARVLRAQVILLQAKETDDPSIMEEKFYEAFELLKAAASKSEGFFLLQTKQLAAESLIRWALLLKNLETTSRFPINGQKGLSYQQLFTHARALLDNVLSWENTYNEYNETVKEEANRPLWLKQIATYARIGLANMQMVEIEEDRKGTPREYKTRQLKNLKQVEEDLRRILEREGIPDHPRQGILNDEMVASVKQILAENLARQAFLAKDLGDNDSFQSLLERARSELDQVLADDSQANPFTRALANLWKAKLLLIEVWSAASVNAAGQILDRAQTHLQSALDAGLFRHKLLAEAKQTHMEIQLSRVELRMRQEENYSDASLTELKDLAQKIFRDFPADSPLIPRALRDLIEAYSTREAHQDIIALCDQWRERKELGDEFRAWLYLKKAEVTSSIGRDQLNAADKILDEAWSTFRALLDASTGDPELRTLYLLLRAEIKMRRNNSSEPVFVPELINTVSRSGEIDLITRLLFDQIEGLSSEQKFSRIIKIARDALTPARLKEIEERFGRERRINFLRYKFKLWKSLAEVLSWNKNYQEAADEFKRLFDSLSELHDLLPALETLYRAQIQVNLGDIYRYGRSVKDLYQALNYYREAEKTANNIKDHPDQQNYLLSRIFLGYSKIAEEGVEVKLNGTTYLPQGLRDQAEDYFNKIEHKDNPAMKQLCAELGICGLGNYLPPFELKSFLVSANQGKKELRSTLRLIEPLRFTAFNRQMEAKIITSINHDYDLNSGGKQQTFYAGLGFSPASWIAAETLFRLSTLTWDKDITLQYLKNPDATATLSLRWPWDTPFLRGLSLTTVADLYWNKKEYNNYYEKIEYNFGRDFPSLHGISVGSEFNYYKFNYLGNLAKRSRIAPFLHYEFELPPFLKGIAPSSWPTDPVRLGITVKYIHENATDFSFDGKHQFPKTNRGFGGEVNLIIPLPGNVDFYFRLQHEEVPQGGKVPQDPTRWNTFEIGIQKKWSF